MAGNRAPEESVVSLCIKKPFLVKARLLKAVIHICGYDKMILIFYKLRKSLVNRLRRILIAIYVYLPAPICPVFLKFFKSVKARGIHITKAVFFYKVREGLFKSLP